MWLEEWLEENEVRELSDCKEWKDRMPVLQSAIMGIETIPGSGCTECNFAQERKREVTAHMKRAHGIDQDAMPVPCLLQRVFSSHLRGFWRVQTTDPQLESNDEGLLALRQFSAEMKQMEEQDSRSAVGIRYTWTIELICSRSSRESASPFFMDDEV